MRKSATRSTIAWMDWSGIERNDFVGDYARSIGAAGGTCSHRAQILERSGLSVRDRSGMLLRVDDERLAPIFDKAAELGVPVMFHTADPAAFFCLSTQRMSATRNWRRIRFGASVVRSIRSGTTGSARSCFFRHPDTTFVAAHVAESGEDLGRVASMLEIHPNVNGFYLGAKPRK